MLYASKLYQEWLTDLKGHALLATHNQAQMMFRGVFHGLRRHMSTNQVLNFADALPPLPSGIFLEGWRPTKPEPLATAQVLTQEVTAMLAPHLIPPDTIVGDVLAVLARFSEPHDVEKMRAQLPAPLQALWP